MRTYFRRMKRIASPGAATSKAFKVAASAIFYAIQDADKARPCSCLACCRTLSPAHIQGI